MKLITLRTQARDVADRFAAAYPADRWPDHQPTVKALRALDGETAKPRAIERIIGNDTWCCLQRCHECGKSFDVVVEVGEPADYESHTAQLCVQCLRKALALAGGRRL